MDEQNVNWVLGLFDWVYTNWGTIATVLMMLLGLLAQTGWASSARAKRAIGILARIIEPTGKHSPEKQAVKEQAAAAGPGVEAVINEAVAEVDPKKQRVRKGLIILREILHGVIKVKTAGLVLVLVCIGACVAGCGGKGLNGMLPQVTIVHPDGTVETRVDPEATQILLDAANGMIDSILDRVNEYQARKAEAEARGDAAEAERWQRLIELADRHLPNTKAVAK